MTKTDEDGAPASSQWDEHKLPVQPFEPPPTKRWTKPIVALLCCALTPTAAWVLFQGFKYLGIWAPLFILFVTGVLCIPISLVWSTAFLIALTHRLRKLQAGGVPPEQVEHLMPPGKIALIALILSLFNLVLYIGWVVVHFIHNYSD